MFSNPDAIHSVELHSFTKIRHALMNNRAKKEEEKGGAINTREKGCRRISVMTHRGQYLHLVSPETVQLFLEGKAVETKRDGLAAALANVLQKSSVVS